MDNRQSFKVGPIAIECQRKIGDLLAVTKSEDCSVKEFLHVRDVERIQDRYNQWVDNLGALQHFESPLSLDYRLQDAPMIKTAILNTLTDLDSSLQAATEIAAGILQNRFNSSSILELDTDLSEYNISSSESETSSTLSSDDGIKALAPTSEIQELISAIGSGIDALFKASIFVRRLIQNDEISRISYGGSLSDQDVISKGHRWIKNGCGFGWDIISKKRIVFFAFATFLALYQAHCKSFMQKNEISDYNSDYNSEERPSDRVLSQVDENGQTALHKAAVYGWEAEVRRLLKWNIDVKFTSGTIFKSLSILLGGFMDFTLSSTSHGSGAMILWQFLLFSSLFVLAVATKYLIRIAHIRGHSPSPFEENVIEASPVKYEDEDEQRNASLQRVWSTCMREGGHYMRSQYYTQVKCLLVSWDKEHDDLHTEQEVADLGNLFENTFHFKVKRVLLTKDPKHPAPLQLKRHITKFIWKEDGPKTLLIVYYAGHGAPNPRRGNGWKGLTLNGFRKTSNDKNEMRNEIFWSSQKETLQHAEADVLEIFDCCYAGDLGRAVRIWGPRSFEFLGACSSGQLTCCPGPQSFTRALIWALKAMKAKHKRFTVSELSCTIREAPDFPSDQVPALFIRAPCAIERIMLSPLDDSRDGPAAPTDDNIPQELLQLNFSLAEHASIKVIEELAKTRDKALIKAQLPINRVAWGGLSSVGGPNSHQYDDLRVIQAVREFQEGISRSKSKKRKQ